MNLMKDPERVGGTKVDQIELVANGLKILRLVSTDKEVAVKIVNGYELCVYSVLDLLEAHSESNII